MRKEIRGDHVAIYIRWSTEDQGEGTTLAVQLEGCRHYVLSQGWQVRDDLIFIDDGYSGGSLDRPALDKLRHQVRQGEVDCVVVYKLDRLSRNVVDTVNLVLREWDDATYLKSAREPIDSTNAMGKQFFYMLVSYAEWERNVIRERMFSGRLRRAREGKSPGMPRAYGYKRTAPGSFEIIESEAEVVRLVYDMVEKGTTVRQTTLYLNNNGFPPRKGRGWNTSMVSKMLHNPVYMGTLAWGRWQLNPRHRKGPDEPRVKRSEPHIVIKTPTIPAIISEEQFHRVQRIMEGNKKVAPAALGSPKLLSGIIKCGLCGSSMEFNEAGPKREWTYYRCRSKVYQGHNICAAASVPAGVIEDKLIEEIRTRYEHLVMADDAGEGHEEQHRKMLQQINAAQQALEAQLSRLDNQEKRINADYRSERLTADERRQLLAEVKEERAHFQQQLQKLDQEASRAADNLAHMQEQLRHLTTIDSFRSLPADQQKQILRHFVREVHVSREGSGNRKDDVLRVNVVWKDGAPASEVASAQEQTR